MADERIEDISAGAIATLADGDMFVALDASNTAEDPQGTVSNVLASVIQTYVLTGTAANVTTNANLTGHVTSVGNAAVLGSFTLAQLNTAVSDGTLVSGALVSADIDTYAELDAIVADVTLSHSSLSETLTNKTLTSPVLTTPQINDTSADHQYIFGVSELIADRTVTLPLLTGNDTFVFEAFAATLTNKTLGSGTALGTPDSGNLSNCTAYPSATTTTSGIVELATTAETTTGTDTGRAVTPDGLKDGYQGSTNVDTVGTVTTGTWSADCAADTIDAITEIAAALKSGADGTLVTGTAGVANEVALWNSDGDIVGNSAFKFLTGQLTGSGNFSWTNAANEIFSINGNAAASKDILQIFRGAREVFQVNAAGAVLFGDATDADSYISHDLSAVAASTTRTITWPDRAVDFSDGGTFSELIGSTSITTLGTITTGTWNGTLIEGEGYVGSSGEGGGTKFLREDGDGTCSWQAIPGGGDALTTSPLSQFANTTSLQFKGVIDDETGSGAVVFANTPTLIAPLLGTPTSGNLANCTGYVGDSSLTTVGGLLSTEFTLDAHFGTVITNQPAASSPTPWAQTIDLDASNHQILDLTNTDIDGTLTLTSTTARTKAGTIIIKQHGTTARDIAWVSGTGITNGRWFVTEPTWSSDAADAIRIISWVYDGTDIYIVATDVQQGGSW